MATVVKKVTAGTKSAATPRTRSKPVTGTENLSGVQFGANLNAYRSNLQAAGYNHPFASTAPSSVYPASHPATKTGQLHGALRVNNNTMWNFSPNIQAANPPASPGSQNRLKTLAGAIMKKKAVGSSNFKAHMVRPGRHHGMNAAHLRAATGSK